MNSETLIYAADIESSGLLHHLVEQGDSAKLHNFCAMTLDSKKMYTLHADTDKDYSTIQRFLDRDIVLVMHNGICYDKNALKHFGFDIERVHFVDTLALSWYLDLNRPKHGLESYGEECGVPKPEVDDWENLTQDEYDNRVQEDVKIQLYTYQKLKGMFEELYGKMSDIEFCNHKVVRYLNFKMEQLAEQQNTRFKIDVPKAESLVEELSAKLDEKVLQLSSVMPKVPVYAKHTKPAKPFKKDGSLSVTGEKWKIITEQAKVGFDYDGEIKTIKSYKEPNPQSSRQIKDWLFSFGWTPQTYKFDKDEFGNERKIPQIYIPQSGGQICKSIELLAEQIPDVEHLVGMGVIKHRKGAVQGFLDSLIYDNYIEASASGFTNTLRLKHRKPFVNLPSSRVLYGEDVRSCLISREGKVLLGADLSSLENIIKFNLQLPFDRKYVMSQMSEDFDGHLQIAQEGGLLSEADVHFYKIEKEGFPRENYSESDDLDALLNMSPSDKKIKIKHIAEVRGKGKGTNYSCQYGAGAATVARTAGVALSVGKALVKAYKKVNWSIEKIATSQKIKTVSHGMYQLNPYNGIWYHLKTEKDCFSTLVQGTGSYVLDLWLVNQFKLRESSDYSLGEYGIKLLASAHDEQISELSEGCQSEAKRLVNDSLSKVNERFNLEIPFGCDIQFGNKYSEIH